MSMSTSPSFPKRGIHLLKWVTLAVPLILGQVIYRASYFPSTPVITIPDGALSGRVAISRNGTEYWEFLGIPFAQPPVESLRFQPPVPVEPWGDTVKIATSYPPVCAQFEGIGRVRYEGAEDCLYLNVYTPPFEVNGTTKHRRPVLVNIPGGGFLWGGTQFYAPTYVMDHPELVIVNIQYRVGALGFLNFAQTPEEHASVPLPRGNMGLKDIRLALEWVQRNIENFGGNPKMVTLYGQSAGAAAAHILTLSPQFKGLFHRIFAQSGTAMSHWGFTQRPRQLAVSLASKLGCPLHDQGKLLECLQNADAYQTTLHQECAVDPTAERDIIVPSVETVINEDTFMSVHPYELLKNGSFLDIPMIFGMTTGEGVLRLGKWSKEAGLVENIRGNWEELGPRVLAFEKYPRDFSERVKQFYFPNDTDFPKDSQLFKNQLALMVADSAIYEPVHTSVKIHVARNRAPVRLTLFDFRPSVSPGIYSLYKGVGPQDWLHSELLILWEFLQDWVTEHLLGGNEHAHQYGVGHSEEILYVWVLSPMFPWLTSERDTQFSRDYIQTLVDFVKGSDTLSFRGVPWPAVEKSAESLPYLSIHPDGSASVAPESFTERIQFWRNMAIRDMN